MNSCVFIQAYAKLNLTLDVLGKRNDGYHDIRSIMQSISLYDRLKLTETARGISIETNHPQVPCDGSNLAHKAALVFMEASGKKAGVHINLAKGIPVAAGLGGGSADAAAVLKGLNRLWDMGFSTQELHEIGQELGADVPFCLTGGTMLAEGIGEKLTPLEPLPKLWLVLFKPPFGVSAGVVYTEYDRRKHGGRNHECKEYDARENSELWATPGVLQRLKQDDLAAAVAGMGNMLEPTTISLYPQLANIISSLRNKQEAEKIIICGSGPTICAVFSDRDAAEEFYHNSFDFSARKFAVHSVSRGGVLLERQLRREKVGRKQAFTYKTGKL